MHKHNSSKSFVCELAKIEASLKSALTAELKNIANVLEPKLIDNQYSLIPALPSARTDPLLSQLNSLNIQNATEDEKLQETSIRLLLYIVQRKFPEAVDLDWSPQGIPWTETSTGICILQATVLSSLAQYAQANDEVAYQYVRSAIGLIQNANIGKKPLPELTRWCDLAYSLYAQMSVSACSSQLERANILTTCLSYFTEHKSVNLLYKLVTSRQAIKYLEHILRTNTNGSKIFTKSPVKNLYLNWPQLVLDYGSLLCNFTSFPKAGDQNMFAVEFIELATSIWINTEKSYDITVSLIRMLYQLTGKCFQAQQIFRSLVFFLRHIEEFEEASEAFEIYKFLCVKSHERLARKNSDVAGSFSDIKPVFVDEPKSIIEVCSVMMTVYAQYLRNLKKVSEILDYITKIASDYDLLKRDDIAPLIYHTEGVAYSFMYYQANNPSLRERYHQKSVQSYQKCLEKQPTNTNALFHLAMQYSERRAITDAMQIVRRLLEVNPKYSIVSWHLLVLCVSCSEQYAAGIKLIDSVFETWGINHVNEDGTIEISLTNLTFNDRCALVDLLITKLALFEAEKGVEATLDIQDEIFTLFASIFDLNEYRISKEGSSDELSTLLERSTIQSIKSSKKISKDVENEKGSILGFSRKSSLKRSTVLSKKSHSSYKENFQLRRGKTVSYLNQKLWLTAASLFLKSGNDDQARSALLEAKKIDHECAWVYYLNGLSLLQQGKEVEGYEQLDVAHYLDPEDPLISTALAKCLLQGGYGPMHSRRNRADAILSSCTLQYGWDLPEAWYYTAEIFRQLGDLKQAAFSYDYCIQLADTNPVRRWSNLQPRFMNV